MIKREWPQQWPDMLKEMETLTTFGACIIFMLISTRTLPELLLTRSCCNSVVLLSLYCVRFMSRIPSFSGHTDGAGDADSAATGRGRDHVPDSAPAAS